MKPNIFFVYLILVQSRRSRTAKNFKQDDGREFAPPQLEGIIFALVDKARRRVTIELIMSQHSCEKWKREYPKHTRFPYL